MNVCIHKTHPNWLATLNYVKPKAEDVIAFWKTPSKAEKNFGVISKGEILFFNVEGSIKGGGTFIEFISSITIAELWNKYGFFSGAKSLEDLENDIQSKSCEKLANGINTQISYIKLDNVFWFNDTVAKIFTEEFKVQSAQNPVKKYTISIN